MEGLTAIAVFGLVVLKLSDLVKFVTQRNWNSFLMQLLVMAVGIVAVVLGAHSNFSANIELAGTALRNTNGAGQVLLGIVVGSVGSGFYDAKSAIDNNDSASTGRANITSPPPPNA